MKIVSCYSNENNDNMTTMPPSDIDYPIFDGTNIRSQKTDIIKLEKMKILIG